MTRAHLSAAVLLFVLISCQPREEAAPIAQGPAAGEVAEILRAYLAANLAGDAAETAAMYVEEIRGHADFERYHERRSAAIQALGEPLGLSFVQEVPGGSGTTHVYHAEFAKTTGRIFVRVRPADGLLEGVFFEPFAEGQTEDPRDRFEARIFERDSEVLPYRLLKPKDYDPNRSYPLVLFFHGAGQRGDENIRQIANGIWGFSDLDIRHEYPCFVVAPQCPADVQWVDTPWTADAHSMPESPAWPLRLSMELLDALQVEFPIDEDRIYVTGLSMGGFGAWDAIQRYPERFAAAVPICGGGDPDYAGRITAMPIWAFHGDQDSVVKVERSRDMIAAIEAAGGNPRYTEYPGVNHNSWTPAYRNRDLYAWMFAHRLSDRNP